MMEFWKDNSAQGPAEIAINQMIVDLVRMVNTGLLPTFQTQPVSPVMQSMTQFADGGQREGFCDFRGLLETHIDFAEIASWGRARNVPC